jgi:hypothetical protein
VASSTRYAAVRYIRLTTKASKALDALPAELQEVVTRRLADIANDPDPTTAADWREVAPDGVNSGLIFSPVLEGVYFLLIAYRIVRERQEVWCESIRRIYGDGSAK